MIFDLCVCAEDESEFDYIKGSHKCPSHWGKLKKEWLACNNGRMQSPIDLSNHRVRVVPNLGELKKHYKPQNATVKNRGHDIEVNNNLDVQHVICLGLIQFFGALKEYIKLRKKFRCLNMRRLFDNNWFGEKIIYFREKTYKLRC